MRGPGDLFGIRQSGILDFRLGDVFQDSKILKDASETAGLLLEEDPKLEKPEYCRLRKAFEHVITKNSLETTL